jgi:hypothetical protein
MEYIFANIVPSLTCNFAFSLINGITAAARSVSTLAGKMKKCESNEVRNVINDTDLEISIKVIQCLINEIRIDENTPITIRTCLKELFNIIKEINAELERIDYRVEYNKTLYFGKTFRGYRFENCAKRLRSHVVKLNNRKKLLLDILAAKGSLGINSGLTEYYPINSS